MLDIKLKTSNFLRSSQDVSQSTECLRLCKSVNEGNPKNINFEFFSISEYVNVLWLLFKPMSMFRNKGCYFHISFGLLKGVTVASFDF